MKIKRLLLVLFLTSFGAFSQSQLTEVKVVPNPFAESTKILFYSKAKQTIVLQVKDVLGKTVFKKQYSVAKGGNRINFEKNNLHAGMYIFAIQSKNQVISKRFVIQ